MQGSVVRLLILSLFLLISAPDAATAERAEPSSYRVQFSAENPKRATVEANLVLREGTIRMAQWGHPYLPQGWATFVRDLEVTDESGQGVEITPGGKDTWGSWGVNAQPGTRLHLSYAVDFTQDRYDWNDAGGQDSRPALTNGALFLVTKALFIYAPGSDGAVVELDLPDGWSVSSPWPAAAGQQNTFVAGSWISLVNNALVVGPHTQHVIEDGNMTVVLALDSELSESQSIFEQTFTKLLGEYREIFDGTPETRYLVAIRVADEDDGEAFKNSFNQVVTAGRFEERAIVWANTMGHELFHFWNGSILAGADKAATEWFSEGFTEYYASLSLLRTGLISEELWFRKLESYLARHFVATRMWPIDTPTLVEAGKEKHKNWLRVYGSGATLALMLDIEIRSATSGVRGLDDVMRAMRRKFGDTDTRYEIADILEAVNQVSGEDFGTFFRNHVYETGHSLDIAGVLQKAGLNTEQFSDEYYLTPVADRTPAQATVFNGITKQQPVPQNTISSAE